ncbi:hypothetical protein CHS0354_013276 [Potamilus streckersoni]|uniref:Uncharacterized protein n=1 Tax=Potamilus streckersoni TaxID=2493646 RepID=A0AAE0VYH3_9BIVA|nr:hypothetical protein CHS0354_013276 [Potamilus streckersoni]
MSTDKRNGTQDVTAQEEQSYKCLAKISVTYNHPKTNPFYYATNKMELGKFRDKTSGIPITEFIGLRFKMYCFTLDDDILMKKTTVSKSHLSVTSPPSITKQSIHMNIKHSQYSPIKRMINNTPPISHKPSRTNITASPHNKPDYHRDTGTYRDIQKSNPSSLT